MKIIMNEYARTEISFLKMAVDTMAPVRMYIVHKPWKTFLSMGLDDFHTGFLVQTRRGRI